MSDNTIFFTVFIGAWLNNDLCVLNGLERNLAKVEVGSSSLLSRSNIFS
jgi:hypothetical protein